VPVFGKKTKVFEMLHLVN